MEATKDQRYEEFRALLDKLAWQKKAEALYDAFIEALEEIPSRDVKSDCALNVVKYMATKNASARASNKLDEAEVATLFEEECKRFSDDLLAMPGQFREWLAKTSAEERETQARPPLVDVLVAVLRGGVCDCPRCRSFREDVQGARAEAPTERPPAPDVH